MKRIVLILLLSYAYIAQAQYLAPLDAKNSGARSVGILVTDSMQNMRFFDTATCKLAFPSKLAGRIARQSGRLYYNPTGTKFVLLDSVVVSSAFDTTNIYAQLALRVKYSDTASMLANYLNSGDIGVSVQGYNANTTILGNTTSGSGGTILLQGSPTITLPNIAAINVSGGILSLPTGASGTLMRLSDTSTLSTRINNKLSISDTASMLSPYYRTATATASLANKLNILDTSTMLSPYLRKVDTTAMLASYYDVRDTGRSNGNIVTGGTLSKVTDSLGSLIGGGGVSPATSAELNTGTDNAKFASPLGLEGSKYVEQDNAKLYATTTGTATAYVLTTAPSFTPATGTVISVKFHLANTGAATINVNGSGAVALQKDLSTALVANDIPINSEYTIRRTSTGWLITDIGFAGISLSARLLGAIGDEVGTGFLCFNTNTPFVTSITGSATFALCNTVTTSLSAFGATTAFTAGGTPTTSLTASYFNNVTASGQTKSLVFGSSGASGSNTNVTFGSATSGANNTFTFNRLLTSGSTNDSLLVIDPTTGVLKRISSARIGGVGGSVWPINGYTASPGDWIGTNNAQPWIGKVNNQRSMFIDAASTYNAIYGYGAAPSLSGSYNVVIGGNACTGNTASSNSIFIGTSVASSQSGGDKNICISGSGGQLPNTSGNDQVNIGNVIWAAGANGTGTTPAGRIGIGTNAPNAGSILELSSTTQGFLPTRMTGTQAAAITPKEEGLMVYVKDATGGFAAKGWYGWNGAAWEKLNP